MTAKQVPPRALGESCTQLPSSSGGRACHSRWGTRALAAGLGAELACNVSPWLGPWTPFLSLGCPSSPPFSSQLPPELAYDVLSVADMYLLPGLKQLCGRGLAQLLDEDSVVGVWRVAKLFGLARLEDQCTKYMAKVIEKVSVGPGWLRVGGGRALSWPVRSCWSGRTSWRR